MKASDIIQLCAKLETKLDHHLFAREDEEDKKPGMTGIAVKAGGAAALGTAGLALSPTVTNRLGGLRASVPGFTGKSRLAQRVIATGSVVKDAVAPIPGKAASAAASLATGVKRAGARASTAYAQGRNVAGLSPLAAGARAGKKALNPLLGGLKRIARLG